MPNELPLKASILDKLIGDIGSGRTDAGRDRLPYFIPAVDRFDERELRLCVQRDIAWVMNDINFASAVDLTDYPEIATSVLNYGLPELTGRSLDRIAMLARVSEIGTAIRAFEERLRPDSLRVDFDEGLIETENKLRFSISAEVRNAVEESWIELKTTVDLDDGHVEVEA